MPPRGVEARAVSREWKRGHRRTVASQLLRQQRRAASSSPSRSTSLFPLFSLLSSLPTGFPPPRPFSHTPALAKPPFRAAAHTRLYSVLYLLHSALYQEAENSTTQEKSRAPLDTRY
eukprot:scaffold59141_cov37-Tisochrysis_lutea.AAC.4